MTHKSNCFLKTYNYRILRMHGDEIILGFDKVYIEVYTNELGSCHSSNCKVYNGIRIKSQRPEGVTFITEPAPLTGVMICYNLDMVIIA